MGAIFFFPLSADVVANQAFIVAATAQSLQRQDGAFSAFVPSASASPSVPTPPMRLGKKNHFLQKRFLTVGGSGAFATFASEAAEQGGWGRQVSGGEQAGPVFDRCALLLEPGQLGGRYASVSLGRVYFEPPAGYLRTCAKHVATGAGCVGGRRRSR